LVSLLAESTSAFTIGHARSLRPLIAKIAACLNFTAYEMQDRNLAIIALVPFISCTAGKRSSLGTDGRVMSVKNNHSVDCDYAFRIAQR
jgi:hypothetical protein